MIYSKYQNAIFAFVRGEASYSEAGDGEVAWDAPLPEDYAVDFRGKRNAVVEAVAGSGKTTTIVKALDFLAADKPLSASALAELTRMRSCFGGTATLRSAPSAPRPKVLFAAYNKHIAEELQRRVPGYVQASTLNSFGWSVCKQNVGGVDLDKYKDENILRTFLSTDDEDQRKVYYRVKGAVAKMVGLLKALLITDRAVIEARFTEVADKYDVEIPEVGEYPFDFKRTVIDVWQMSVDCVKWMSYDDQVFMPLHQGWEIPTFDWVFGDEVQDWSPMQIEIVRRASRNGRAVLVGDRSQSIYGFRGADPDAIPNIVTAFDAVVLPMNYCYRCPDSVIREARKIVAHIENPVPNLKGEGGVEKITTPAFISRVGDGDFVLCRTTAPLVKRCLELIGMRRKAVVKGRDIGQGLKDMLERLSPSPATPVADFLESLAQFRAEQMVKLAKSNREAEAQATEDRCETLQVLALGCRSTADVAGQIDNVFSDADSTGVTFCTGHRAKGLEADNIYILRPDLCPHPKSKKDWQQTQEFNLKYVMITRAMKSLCFVMKERDER